MYDFQSHQSYNRHTFGASADISENKVAPHLSQLVLIVALLGGYLEILWFELKMIQRSFWTPLT